MEQTVEQFWVRGEAATMARWVLALPDPLVREHTRLALTTALYLLHPVTYSTREQRESRHQQVRQLMARVEAALQHQANETNQEILATRAGSTFRSDLEAREASEALLHRRLRLLRAGMALYEAIAASEYERLPALHQEMQELDQDEEVIWHMLPLFCNVVYYAVRQEGAKLLPQLLDAKQRVRRSGSHFAATRVMQWLALSAVEAGQLRLAYQESLAALDLIEQMAGYALLKGYFKDVLAMVLYQWNRLEEARGRLRTVIQDAATWQQSDLLLSGYIRLMQVELARGDLSAVQQALHEFEQLEGYQGYHHWSWLPIMRAQWWLAQGQMKEAADWAVSIVFPEGAWERSLYDAFPVVMRVYFAELRWTEALELLDRFSGSLDRSANSRITLTYLAQYMVALHHAGQNEQAHEVAARLFALTEPEGYLRVYLDEGEPMRQALEALLPPHSQQHELAPSTRAYISKLLAVFEQERQGAGTSLAAPTPEPALPSAQQASAVFSAPGASLTRREQEVLRLLATGASNQEIAQTLVIELPTVKKHVSNLLGKLRASSRTQAISRARALSLL